MPDPSPSLLLSPSLMLGPWSASAPTPDGLWPPNRTTTRARSPLLRKKYPADAPAGGDDLDVEVEDARLLVGSLTGRDIGTGSGEAVPAVLRPVALRAVARMVEQVDAQLGVDEAGSAAVGKRVRSISAGPWSETYFAPGELVLKNGRPQMSPDALLDALLWALATDDAKEDWIALATGVQPPAGALTAFDYRRMGGGISGSGIAHPDRW